MPALAHVRRNGVGYLALFVALGGTSYAATALPRNSVGTTQLKSNAVTGAKIKNGSVGLKDLAASARPAATKAGPAGAPGTPGAAGVPGVDGPAGPKGDTGPAGPFPDTLPSGRTLTGFTATAGRKVTSGGFVGYADIHFAFPLESIPTVSVRPVGSGPNAACPGSATAPAATPGNLCVYVTFLSGTTALAASGDALGAGRRGVVLLPQGVATDTNYEVRATWAVTAP